LFRVAIVYGANHGNEHVVTWWDAVDYIGIDGNPSLSALRNAPINVFDCLIGFVVL
jgi:sulfur transfer complex TusBCD TusB component (DsrH family)